MVPSREERPPHAAPPPICEHRIADHRRPRGPRCRRRRRTACHGVPGGGHPESRVGTGQFRAGDLRGRSDRGGPPRGVDDELPFEADELRRSKNPPPAPAPKKTAPAKKAPRRRRFSRLRPRRRAPPPSPASPSAAPTPAPAPVRPAPTQSAPTKSAPAKRASAKSGAPTSVTVTLHGAPDNTWSVAVARGARKPQRARPVSPDAVEAAVAGLGDPSSLEAVTTLLHAAREEARQRVDALSRELEEARQALAALTESGPRRTPLT
ncbi:DUF6319 family protein [Gordonia alkaliphila]|uniref:DUF6319 family protein n=1 Tax=Gordonia alkaliphila TaxID=1053547 RepID=UPI0027E336FE|nr:DUF6319 family protein [Gordonia alkaliphila]